MQYFCLQVKGPNVEGKNRFAVLSPGRAYVNGRRLLADVVKSTQQLRMILPVGSTVFVDVTQFDSSTRLVGWGLVRSRYSTEYTSSPNGKVVIRVSTNNYLNID